MSYRSFALVLLLALFAAPDRACGQEKPAGAKRPAAAIVREFNRVTMPSMSDGNSEAAVKKFKDAINRGCSKQAELAWELYQGYPDHTSVPSFLSKRWSGMSNALNQARDVLDETIALLRKEERQAVRHQALLAATRAAMVLDDVPVEKKLRYANASCEVVPDDERGPLALMDIAKYHLSDVDHIRKISEKVKAGWGETRWAGPAAKSVLKQLKRIGRDFQLEFTNVLDDQKVNTEAWKGQPFVVMIWSGFGAWVEPDLEAIKARRKAGKLDVVGIYNWRYKDGRSGLASILKKKGYDWPQYYAYKKGQTPWNGEWATGETPLYFLVDAKGKIVALSYRFKNIEASFAKLGAAGTAKKKRKI